MKPNGRVFGEYSRVALMVAKEAGRLLMQGYRSRPQADEKSRADLVTEFDRRSEALIIETLTELTPKIPVVGEEQSAEKAAKGGSAVAEKADLVWYVDPLDGTTNFVHGHPFFNVSIGLMYRNVPVAGAVVAPALKLQYWGFCEPGGIGEAHRNEERCYVSPIDSLSKSMLGTGFPPNREIAPDNNFDSFISVKRAAQAVRRCGAAALDLCFVAEGIYDGYWERRLHPWDICGAGALVLAAGGRITSLDGGPPNYHEGNVVASNGKIHDELIEAISGKPRQLLSPNVEPAPPK